MLDELNLAPSEVLEALNRLLDDNRELFIPETQQIVKPHPHFMLFATQNPPGLYGGRKLLSRAFRNRFLELHFEDIPDDELEEIISVRSERALHAGASLIRRERVCVATMRNPSIVLQETRVGDEGPATPSSRHQGLCRQAWLHHIARPLPLG